MSTHKYIDKICCIILALTLVFTVAFMNAKSFGVKEASKAKGYESRLFDTSLVHTIDIVIDDWEDFLEGCTSEEYSLCSVVVDKEAYKNVGIRAKGNTSLTQVESYGNDRYSFKVEFDHYDSMKNYYGLDKLCLNNIIQDNTYMKDYLAYQMMGAFGVDAPLCSYAYITVNGEDWGLYLAVEGVEEAFLERNYGSDYGELYKPDSQTMGGGRGNGGGFDMEKWKAKEEENGQSSKAESTEKPTSTEEPQNIEESGNKEGTENTEKPQNTGSKENGGGQPPEMPDGEMPGGQPPEMPDGGMPDGDMGGGKGQKDGQKGGRMKGSDDVTLVYSDDEISSYQNIFDNAKTDVTEKDKKRLIASLKQMNEKENIEEVVNIEEVIRYFVVHNFVCNFDSYTGSMIHNYYLYEKDGQLSMVPWDYNLAFGGFMGQQDASELVNYPIDTPVSGGTVDSRPMLAWIFSDEGYQQKYHQYFKEFIADYFDSGYFTEMIDKVQAMISPYVEKDPTKFCSFEEFEKGAAALKKFCLLRAESVKGQLDGTISATSDGQKENQDSLVDASGLTISDMGNMHNSFAGAPGKMGKGSRQPSSDTTEGNTEDG
ncbi:spore coat protein CotH [bacterium D16-51]|nr:spore coat protein CotH [bacterium D16-59]RKI54895.1 spore coat protein CotH [bacterium D16-51]